MGISGFKISELITDMHQCEEIAIFENFIYTSLSEFAIIKLSYHHLPQMGSFDFPCFNVLNYGFPAEFNKRYHEEQLHLVDPTLLIVMAQTRPIWWGEIELPAKLSPQEIAYLELCAVQGFGCGLTIPVFGPHGRNGFFSIGFGQERPELKAAQITDIQLFFQSSHLHYCKLLSSSPENRKKLSKREREILTWVARGKGNAVIADILEIKETSVVTYLQRTFDKLGVNNRVTATLRALAIGELSL